MNTYLCIFQCLFHIFEVYSLMRLGIFVCLKFMLQLHELLLFINKLLKIIKWHIGYSEIVV